MSIEVDAAEKSVGSEPFVSFVRCFRKLAGREDGFEAAGSRNCVCIEAEEHEVRREEDDGRHCAQERGKIWVHRTDLGPCTSQKWVKESCEPVSLHCFRGIIGILVRRIDARRRHQSPIPGIALTMKSMTGEEARAPLAWHGDCSAMAHSSEADVGESWNRRRIGPFK